MVEIALKIQEVIDSPRKPIDKAEAIKILRNCGVLDKKNEITPKYKDIVVYKKDEN